MFSNAFRKKGGYSVRFERIVRLAPGDGVTYNGVKVGAVTAITPVVENGVPEVKVEYSIDGSYRDAVLVGPTTEFKIDQGLLGGSSLAIVSHGGQPMKNEGK